MFEFADGAIADNPTFTYADAFAGIGGFAAVLESLGGQCTYAVEFDEHAAAVYERNWRHRAYGDITLDATDRGFRPLAKLEGQKLGEPQQAPSIDVFTGGFPCQPFSKSGAQRGMDETRGTLFWNIETVLREARPTLVVLENVRNLAGPRHLHEWGVIIDHLRQLGYQVSSTPAIFSPHQIKPEFGGAPQVRERVYITATLIPEGMVADPFVEPVRLPDHVLMDREWDLRTDLPLDDSRAIEGTGITAEEHRWIDHWDEMVQALREFRIQDANRVGEVPRPLPGHPIWANVWTRDQHRRRQLEFPDGVQVPSWKRDFLHKNWHLYDSLRARGDAAWLERWLRITRTFPESRQKLEWQAQDAASVWDCVISLRPSGVRVKRMTHLPALVAIAQTPILGPVGRRLSVGEAARLQGLDGFDFGEQRAALSYKQLGNGVNTGVVLNVLKAHVLRDQEALRATAQGRALLKALSGDGGLSKVGKRRRADRDDLSSSLFV